MTEMKKNNVGKVGHVLPRRADAARDARRVGRAGDIQHEVAARRHAGHSASLLGATVVHLTRGALPDLWAVWL